MLSKLYKLADNDYATNHDYFVDGTPTVGDAFFGGTWHTILVGGYRAGGNGYYALDITDPANPLVLWEFSNLTNPSIVNDKDLGLSFGNPIITKRKDGTWVVAFASGYNNTANGGDGNGHLYVVDAATGGTSLLLKLNTYTVGTTPAGTSSNPSGLAPINDWVDFDTENLAKRFYGVDLLGNVWRFDIDGNVVPNNAAFLLAQLKDASLNAQPVTTKPILAQVTYNGVDYPIVYVATGAYLGNGDLTTTTQQSSYAFIDPLTAISYGDIRAGGTLIKKTGASSTVNWSTKKGWYYDYATTGERANVNSVIALTTITTATNVPSADLCAMGGSSFIYTFDLFTGNFVRTSMGATLTVGITVVQLTDGATETLSTNSKGDLSGTPNQSSVSAVKLRRSSWRELD
jgi:type IV pilus assembly protein PilY1